MNQLIGLNLCFVGKGSLNGVYTSLEMLWEEDGQAWNQTGVGKRKNKTQTSGQGPCARSGDILEEKTR